MQEFGSCQLGVVSFQFSDVVKVLKVAKVSKVLRVNRRPCQLSFPFKP